MVNSKLVEKFNSLNGIELDVDSHVDELSFGYSVSDGHYVEIIVDGIETKVMCSKSIYDEWVHFMMSKLT